MFIPFSPSRFPFFNVFGVFTVIFASFRVDLIMKNVETLKASPLTAYEWGGENERKEKTETSHDISVSVFYQSRLTTVSSAGRNSMEMHQMPASATIV